MMRTPQEAGPSWPCGELIAGLVMRSRHRRGRDRTKRVGGKRGAVPGEDVAGLPELVVEGLAEGDARELLESVLTGPLDARVRDRIIADTHGNPLALLELPRGLTPAQMTGGFGVSGAVPLDGRIEESFGRQLETLPAQTQRLVWLAAADPSGDPVLVWRAAGRLAIGAGAAGRRRRRAWRSSARRCGSGIRWCARRPTGRHRSRRGRSCTARWPRSPIGCRS